MEYAIQVLTNDFKKLDLEQKNIIDNTKDIEKLKSIGYKLKSIRKAIHKLKQK